MTKVSVVFPESSLDSFCGDLVAAICDARYLEIREHPSFSSVLAEDPYSPQVIARPHAFLEMHA